jgi:hypothetical protein
MTSSSWKVTDYYFNTSVITPLTSVKNKKDIDPDLIKLLDDETNDIIYHITFS